MLLIALFAVVGSSNHDTRPQNWWWANSWVWHITSHRPRASHHCQCSVSCNMHSVLVSLLAFLALCSPYITQPYDHANCNWKNYWSWICYWAD